MHWTSQIWPSERYLRSVFGYNEGDQTPARTLTRCRVGARACMDEPGTLVNNIDRIKLNLSIHIETMYAGDCCESLVFIVCRFLESSALGGLLSKCGDSWRLLATIRFRDLPHRTTVP